jgi:Zn-dependent protease
MPDIASGLVYYVVFLFSTTLHEAAHAWTAMRGGDRTAYHGGQVTLDPLPHIRREPFGMVVLPLLSVLLAGWPMGFASAPFDPAWALRHPRRAAWMALTGPVGNLILVLVAAIAIRAGLAAGVFVPPDAVSFGHIVDPATPDGPWHAAGFVASAFFSLNLLLCLFNLIPLPPLDGSGIVPLFLEPARARAYQEFIFANRGLGMLGMLVAWKIFDPIFHPAWLFAVNLLHTGVSYGSS